jgi:hypothetical protein
LSCVWVILSYFMLGNTILGGDFPISNLVKHTNSCQPSLSPREGGPDVRERERWIICKNKQWLRVLILNHVCDARNRHRMLYILVLHLHPLKFTLPPYITTLRNVLFILSAPISICDKDYIYVRKEDKDYICVRKKDI